MTRLIKTLEQPNGLPLGYKEVEYLQTSGTQYIDSGVPNTEDLIYQITVAVDEYQNNTNIFGVIGDSQNSTQRAILYQDNLGIQRGIYGAPPITIPYDSKFHTYYSAPGTLKIDSKTVSYTKAFSGDLGTRTFLIGAYCTYTPSMQYAKPCKIAHATFYDHTGMICDLVPCVDPLGKPCMFDKVKQKPHYNANSTGNDFTYGREIHYVEYLESTSTVKGKFIIDTEIVGKDGIESEVVSMFDHGVNNECILGSWKDANTRCWLAYVFSNKWHTGYNTNTSSNIDLVQNQWNNVKTIIDEPVSSTVGIYHINVNGVDSTYTSNFRYTRNWDNGVTLTLFGMNNNTDGDTYSAKCKVKSCKLWDNKVLVRDYVAAIDENNTPFMFDRVTHRAFLNSGTDTFLYGNLIYIPKLRLIKERGNPAKALPAGYTQVEYLESTGTQYIDTGVTGNNNTKIDVLFSKKNTSATYINGIVGARGSSVNVNNIVVGINDAQIAIDFVNGGSGSYATYRYIVNNTLEDVKYRAISSKTERSLYQGDTLVGQNTALNSQTINTTNLWMFGVQNYGFTEAKIYYCKIYDDGTLVRDFVPALDTTGKPCMYDLVSKAPFYNQATTGNDFSYDMLSKPRLISYIEATGTQMIQPLVYVNSGDTFTLEVQGSFTETTGYSQFMGVNGGAYFGLTPTGYYTIGEASGSATGVLADTNCHTFSMTATIGSNVENSLLIDGLKYTYTRSNTAGDIRIFDCYNSYKCRFRLYRAKIYKGTELVRDLIPAINSNNYGCLYDTITHNYYNNTGSGSFKVGENKTYNLTRTFPNWIEGYTLLNYIESTGTQYINTGIIPTDVTGFEIKHTICTANSKDNMIAGCRQTSGGQNRFWADIDWTSNNKSIGWGFGDYSPQGTGTYRKSIAGMEGEIVTNSMNYMNCRYCTVDGVKYDDSMFTRTLAEITYPIYVFCANAYGTANYFNNAKIYYAKFSYVDKLIMHLVPAKRNSDNEIGFLDMISKQFFTNQGTGTFNYG